MTDTGQAVARLRKRADELQAHLRKYLTVDQLAYSQLTSGGERYPWTLAAQRTWEQGGGSGHDHHRAVSYHARAYDLEHRGEVEAAHEYWLAALRCWARVAADNRFWKRMRKHLAAATGSEPPADLVASVRARLPRNLLEPNLTRAVELRTSRPDQARMHITAVRESGFPSRAIIGVRREFAEQPTTEAMRGAQAGRYDTAVDTVEPSLAADPTNPRLVEALLYVALQAATGGGADEGSARLGVLLDRVASLVEPYVAETGLEERSGAEAQIVRDFARFEFFRGLQQRARMMDAQEDAPTAAAHARAAVTHMKQALARDPELSDDGYFYEARELLTQQYVYAAFFTQETQRSDGYFYEAGEPLTPQDQRRDDAVLRFLGPALRRLGTRPSPEGQPELAALVVARLAVPEDHEMYQAMAVVDHLLTHPATRADKRRTLVDTHTLLSLREGYHR